MALTPLQRSRRAATVLMGYASLLAGRRRNLLTYSEQLGNAAWSTSNGTITSTNLAGPDGTLTAEGFTPSAQFGAIQQLASYDAGWYTVSADLRVASGTRDVAIGFTTSGAYPRRSIHTVTTTWGRYTYTGLHNDTSVAIGAMIQDRNAAGFVEIEIANVQFERGDAATAYQRTEAELA